MKFDSKIHHRQSNRLKEYDYSLNGMYFFTICVQNKECLFGEVLDDEMILNEAGRMIECELNNLQGRFNNFELDEFIVMPNHFHGIISIDEPEIVGVPLVGTQTMKKLLFVNICLWIFNCSCRRRAGTRHCPYSNLSHE